MNSAHGEPIVAVDVGNSRFKLGLFDAGAMGSLPALDGLRVPSGKGGQAAHGTPLHQQVNDPGYPVPRSLLEFAPDGFDGQQISDWLREAGAERVTWRIASVHRGSSQRLETWLDDNRGDERRTRLEHADLPLKIDVEHPERVGIDRLLAAVAVNEIRDSGRPAVVVDHGSAITVDLIDADGTFRGGAILPGIGMAAQALDRLTDRLPLVDVGNLSAPDAVGRSTEAAIRSGLFWGAVGAVGELIVRLAERAEGDPQVIVTGGAGQQIAEALTCETRFVPHLILSGIVLSAPKAP